MRLGVASVLVALPLAAFHLERVAQADSAPAAQATANAGLVRARAAWDRGDFDLAEALYRDAIDQGGLLPSELVDSYVHLGAARGVQGKKEGALTAFRRAAMLDARFVVPPEAGRKVTALAETARREQAKMGPLVMRVAVPTSIAAGKPFTVKGTLDAPHAAFVTRVGLDVRDAVTGARYTATQPAATDLSFDVPAKVTAVDGTLSVQVTAYDDHENQIQGQRAHVTVTPAPAAASYAVTAAVTQALAPPAPSSADHPTTKSSGGFFSTAWPYILGGAVLAGAGTALYFAFRPPTDVNVGPAQVGTAP
jgi:hypothetical protein